MHGLTIHKLADKSVTETPRPLLGIRLEPALDQARVPTNVVADGIAEGWITGEGETVVHRPGGPPDDLWRVTHTFRHFVALVFHTDDEGDVRYTVTHQPDKYADHDQATYPDQVKKFKAGDDTEVTDDIYAAGATRVDHFYDLNRKG